MKSRIAKLKIYAVEPALSPVLSGGKAGPHPLQGIGAGFIPPVLNIELIDSIYTVQGEDAFRTAREMASAEECWLAFLLGLRFGRLCRSPGNWARARRW